MTIYLCADCATKLKYTSAEAVGTRAGGQCYNCHGVPSMWPKLQLTGYREKEQTKSGGKRK